MVLTFSDIERLFFNLSELIKLENEQLKESIKANKNG